MSGWWVLAGLAIFVFLVVYAWSNRHHGRHRDRRYICERWSQRIRDWWRWWRALQ